GKLADFVELSKDPYDVDPAQLIEEISVNATWIGGRRIELDVFLDASSSGPSTAPVAPVKHCC
uniref:hypothetical protein n=1 Tax=Cronobacter sakazakii TaxID=28141 RepID=UPI00294B7A44